jgi:hypothetical protein
MRSAVLLLVGFILYVVMGLLHPGGPANNHRVVFAEYARSDSWKAVQLGQFFGLAVIIAGLLVLYFALDVRVGGAAWVARLGAVSAGVAIGLYGVLQAVDGVALKQSVDAWAGALAPSASLCPENGRDTPDRGHGLGMNSRLTGLRLALHQPSTINPRRSTGDRSDGATGVMLSRCRRAM